MLELALIITCFCIVATLMMLNRQRDRIQRLRERQSGQPVNPQPGVKNAVDGQVETSYSQTAGVAQYPSSFSDIYETVFLLRQRLPAELIFPILRQAEYYVCSQTTSTESVRVTESDAGKVYLQSTPIGTQGCGPTWPVRNVVFTIRSHDQGYSWHAQFHKTFDHSWTWFDAQVLRPTYSEDGYIGRVTLQPSGPSRRVQVNRHAESNFETHTVTWSADSDNEEEREWVKALRVGDAITLTVWARFAGWTNHVEYGSIEIIQSGFR